MCAPIRWLIDDIGRLRIKLMNSCWPFSLLLSKTFNGFIAILDLDRYGQPNWDRHKKTHRVLSTHITPNQPNRQHNRIINECCLINDISHEIHTFVGWITFFPLFFHSLDLYHVWIGSWNSTFLHFYDEFRSKMAKKNFTVNGKYNDNLSSYVLSWG